MKLKCAWCSKALNSNGDFYTVGTNLLEDVDVSKDEGKITTIYFAARKRHVPVIVPSTGSEAKKKGHDLVFPVCCEICAHQLQKSLEKEKSLRQSNPELFPSKPKAAETGKGGSKSVAFTDKQYRKLVELLFIGNWVANAARTGAPGDKLKEDYEDLEQYILSFAKQFRADDIVLEEGGELFTTMDFEEGLMPLIEEYDEYTFWEQLAGQMAERDLRKEIGRIRKLKEEHLDRKFDLEEMYQREFNKNGLKNLVLNIPDKVKS